MADKPVTREEKYLAYLTGDYKGELPKPITRKEKYLYELCLKGIGGEISPEEIKNAVNEYLEKNPVKPGATAEQVQQIEQNKTDVASLKEETNSLKEDIANYDSKLRSFEEVDATEVVSGKLINLVNKTEYASDSSCYIKQNIPSYIRKIKVSGKSASAIYDYDLGAFYGSDDNLISKFGNDESTIYTDLDVDVPKGAKYIYVNQNGTLADVYKKVKFFEVIPVNEDITLLKQNASDNKEDVQNVQKKFEFDIEMNMHGILNASPSDSTYIAYSDDEDARCSDYIDCQNFKYISAKCNGSEWSWVITFFNADKLFLPDISIVGVAGKRTYETEIPESAKYVRISTYNADISYFAKIMFSKKNIDADISDLQVRVNALESPNDIYDGCEFALFKKWGLIGDSLSVGYTVSKDGETTLGRNIYYSWGQYLARRIGNTCLNFGRSGVTSKLWMDTSETYCYPRLINPDNLCQAYIIALGASNSEMTLGSITDVNFTDMSQNADTEYGCYAKVINAVRTVSANAPIFLFTLPYPRNSDNNIKAINEMIRTFANDKEHFGKIFLVDLDADYNKYFETGKLEAQIGNTGWHLTSLGYLYASKVNEIALSKVISDNYSDFQDVFLLPCGNNDVLD